MKVTSVLSVCTLALTSLVSANHGQFDHASVAPAHAATPSHNFEHVYARDATRYEHNNEPAHDATKLNTHHWFSRSYKEAAAEPKQPVVAGKPGHHFIRDAAPQHPGGNSWSGSTSSGNPFAGTNMANNPYAGIKYTPGSAISSVRGILTGGTGIQKTCNRCIAAMQVGQSLAQQSTTDQFSKAVVGLCQQVSYQSNSACTSSFAPGKVGPYIQTLQNANIDQDGKSFCKAYFNTC